MSVDMNFKGMSAEELLARADEARTRSYSPYSNFAVGAALLCSDGRVFVGCNIENSAFSPTVCAERVAIFSAVAAGARDFEAIAVSGGPAGASPIKCTPCGVCRQVLGEFCPPDFPVVLRGADGETVVYTLEKLLFAGFSLK